MSRDEREQLQLLLQVARWYYLEDMPQAAIASRLGCSAATVSRHLTEAKRRGLVQFSVGHPLERVLSLEAALVKRFGLTLARVAEPARGVDPASAVGQCAADLLVDVMSADDILGVSNGVTLTHVVDKLQRRHWRDSLVVQMMGSVGRDNTLIDSPEIVRQAAFTLGGDYRLMPAPLMVGSSRLALALRRDEAVRNALALASRADVALVGVGTFGPEGSGHIFIGYEDPAWSEELRRAGAVGHTCGRHFDADGNPIDNEATRRVIGVQLESLRAIPVVVGVAYGPEKVRSIRGALRGGYLHHLVTDAPTAQALLAG